MADLTLGQAHTYPFQSPTQTLISLFTGLPRSDISDGDYFYTCDGIQYRSKLPKINDQLRTARLHAFFWAADYDTVKPYLKQICSEVDIPNLFTNISENTTVRLERHINKTENNFLLFLIHEEHIKNKTFPNNSSANDNIFGLNNFTEQVLPNESFINDLKHKSENNSEIVGGLQSFFYIKEAFQTTKEIKVPNFKARIFVLVLLDGITTLFFTMDIMIRLLTCQSVRRYFSSVINCADIISLLGIYLYLILYSTCTHLRYGSWIDRLAYMQVLRVLRFFRIIVNVRAGKVMWYSVRKNMKDLSILVLFLITAMTTFASCFYIAESGKPFNSIPDAWYWAIITLTTVGYGDIHPQSKTGRLVACVCAVSGILLLALTVPIFANNFLLLYQHTETENIVTKFRKRSKRSKRQRKMHSGIGDE
jgi:voltage-gated potassium channel Kch